MRSSSTSRSSPRGGGEHNRVSSFSKMDPLKSSILASSQGGWTQSPTSPTAPTSPLRISKRDNEPPIASVLASLLPRNANHSGVTRRSSSSYNHMRNHSLVSKSPFRSPDSEETSPSLSSDLTSPEPVSSPATPKSRQGPVYPSSLGKPSSKSPSHRRVSPNGVIRTSGSGTVGLGITARKASPGQAARRVSLEKKKKYFNPESFKHAREKAKALEAQNLAEDLGYKRRQSKGLQGLEKAEYVSKSPFVSGVKGARAGSPMTAEVRSNGLERQSSLVIHDLTPETAVEYSQESRSPPTTPSTLVDDGSQQSQQSQFSPAIFVTQDYEDVPTDEDEPIRSSISPSHRRRRSLTPHESPAALGYLRKTPSPSPHKSSLKSPRRLRGPRSPDAKHQAHLQRSSSGGRIVSGSRRKGSIRRALERRKVTFDEECDVVEFEREEHEYMSDEDEEGEWFTSEDDDVGIHEGGEYEYDEQEGQQFNPRREEELGRRVMAEVDAIDGMVKEMLEDELAYELRHQRRSGHEDDGDQSFDRSMDSLDRQSESSLIIKPRYSDPIQEEEEGEDEDASFDLHQAQSQETITEEDVSLDLSVPLAPPPPPFPLAVSASSPFIVSAFGSNGSLPSGGSPAPLSDSKSSSYASLSKTASPRISKEEVRRRLMIQRGEGSVSPDLPSPSGKRALPSLPTRQQSGSPTVSHHAPSTSVDMSRLTESSDAVLQRTARNDAIEPPRPSLGERSVTTDGTFTPGGSSRVPAQFGFAGGVDIADVKSALDRLITGVINDRASEQKIQPPLPPKSPSTPPPPLKHPRPLSSMGMSPGSKTPEMTHQHLVPIGTEASVAMSPRMSSTTATTEEEDGPITPPIGASAPNVTVKSGGQEDVFGARPMSMLAPSTNGTGLIRKKSGKEIIKAHEAAIIAKRREWRQRDADGEDDDELETIPIGRRKSKRRSLSTGDAENERVAQIRASAIRSDVERLEVDVEETDLPFTDSVDRELNRMFVAVNQRTYHLKQHERTIYAASDEKVSHGGRAGDLHSGKAWRVVRRPSDMNEYARQIKEYRAQEKGNAHGKVFVKVLGIKGLNVPLPSQSTAFNLTLNNGIHCVATPDCRLARDSRIDQEFELIEHGKLEFTLTIKVRKDPHIVAQLKGNVPQSPPAVTVLEPPAPAPTPTPAPAPTQPQKSGGFLGFFGNSKKPKHRRAATEPQEILQPPPPPPPAPAPAPRQKPAENNLAKHLRPDGTLATAFISFKEIAHRCDTRLFETSYPLTALVKEGKDREQGSPAVLGEIILQIFRLPPLPGVKPDDLPQSLEECHRGLRHIAWHKVMYHEGVLTQQGGDCNIWKRRHFRVIGANLVAYNDVTNRATATIELKKATAVIDDQDPESAPAPTKGRRQSDDDDGAYHVERSFRLLFANDQQISFFADTDEEKGKWLEILRALIGRIPPNPLWAELVWQRQEEMALAANASRPSSKPRP